MCQGPGKPFHFHPEPSLELTQVCHSRVQGQGQGGPQRVAGALPSYSAYLLGPNGAMPLPVSMGSPGRG